MFNNMYKKFYLADSSAVKCDNEIVVSMLADNKLYKFMSLLCSSRSRLHTLPSLLLLEPNYDLLKQFGELWGWPLMIRMDYSVFPKQKPLGGIPVYSLEAAKKVSDFLFSIDCFPLFHKHADRFEDEYSIGVLFQGKSPLVHAEVVGKGFDAGDLRLGKSRPHEVFTLDMQASRIRQESLVDESTYKVDAEQRKAYACKLKQYVSYVNEHCRLLPELDGIDGFDITDCNIDFSPPERYTPLKPSIKGGLLKKVETIYYEVLDQLPPSPVYVASFSYLPDHGWLLWDIYGHWYKR